jgi:uncharacterized protein (DUF488 family)
LHEIKDTDNLEPAASVWTIGHSTRALEDFIQLLRSSAIADLVDVRSYPGSRKYPHFNQSQLSRADSGIGYHHLSKLGGRRKPLPDSRNTAWRNASFRAYADYMESEEFQKGIDQLIELASKGRTAIMCAEAVWWRCHRGLIADYFKARGLDVIHIVNDSRLEPHPYTAAARIVEGRLSYAGLFP